MLMWMFLDFRLKGRKETFELCSAQCTQFYGPTPSGSHAKCQHWCLRTKWRRRIDVAVWQSTLIRSVISSNKMCLCEFRFISAFVILARRTGARELGEADIYGAEQCIFRLREWRVKAKLILSFLISPENLAFAQSNEIYSNSFRVTIFYYVPGVPRN